MFSLIASAILASALGPIPDIDHNSDYLVYYGDWNTARIDQARDFQLVILEASRISAEQLAALKRGHNDTPGDDDDVKVLAYISVGEAHEGDAVGDGAGPCHFDGEQLQCANAGVASYYLDDADQNGQPDRNGTWGSYFVDPSNADWRSQTLARAQALIDKGADGLFLDTLDTASPWHTYAWTAEGMSGLVGALRERFPDDYIVANRGLFYFYPSLPTHQWNIGPYINGVMFEAYYTSWDWELQQGVVNDFFEDNADNWANRLDEAAQQGEGFTVLSLDYLNPDQSDYSEMLREQINATAVEHRWVNYVSSTVYLDTIDYAMAVNHSETQLESVVIPEPEEIMTVDGDFEDWLGVSELGSELAGDTASGDDNADLAGVWASHDQDSLYISYAVAGDIDMSGFFNQVWLDIDDELESGYTSPWNNWSLGADLLIENGSIFEHAGATGLAWVWAWKNSAVYASRNGRIELSIPLDVLGLVHGDRIRLVVDTVRAAPPWEMIDCAPGSHPSSGAYTYTLE